MRCLEDTEFINPWRGSRCQVEKADISFRSLMSKVFTSLKHLQLVNIRHPWKNSPSSVWIGQDMDFPSLHWFVLLKVPSVYTLLTIMMFHIALLLIKCGR